MSSAILDSWTHSFIGCRVLLVVASAGGTGVLLGGYFVYACIHNYHESKQEELALKFRHEERLAMIQKGLVPLYDEDDD